MDRISHSTAVDIGGGRMGYRSKDTVAGLPGTVVTATQMNAKQEELMAVIEKAGFVPNANDLTQLAQAIQSGALNWAVATGTANAWTVALNLAPSAHRAGRVLWIKAPATNAQGYVTINLGAAGIRQIKKRDGVSNPEIGDLVAGVWYPIIDTGAYFCVVTPLSSDIVAGLNAAPTPPQLNYFELKTAATQSVPSSTVTVVNDLTVIGSKPSDAVFSAGGLITIGPKTAGWWNFTQMYVPSQTGGAPSITQAYLYKNGVNVQNSTNNATFCSNSGTVKVAAGDVLSMAVWHNAGGGRVSRWASANPPDTTFNINHISA
jgi:hypothetical protein